MTAEVLPPPPATCWPVDHACCSDWDAVVGDPPDEVPVYTDEQKAMADALAVMTLRMLTGYRVGGCPVTVRPCRDDCRGQTWRTFPVSGAGGRGVAQGAFRPAVIDGQWVNIGCGCGSVGCSCTQVCDLALPGEPSEVVSVMQDGATIDPTAYRLDGRRLTRIDGDCWPLCQTMTAADDEPGAFAVTYYPAARPDGLAAWCAGRLACEFIAACTGGECELPPTVTGLVRQGVTYDLAAGAFANGLTGIREVDAFILRWNPNLLATPSAVWSPDTARPRYTGV